MTTFSHELAASVEELLTPYGVEDREVLVTPDGYSGNIVERIVTRTGSFILKTFLEDDWVSIATGDTECRSVRLWTDGVLDRVPEAIDHACVGAARAGDGWALLMRDVTDAMIPPAGVMPRETWMQLLRAATQMHARFWATDLPDWLCSAEARVGVFKRENAALLGGPDSPAPPEWSVGWDAFCTLVSDDVSNEILRLTVHPERLVAALPPERTLLHGDLKFGNLGTDGDRAIFLDWQAATDGHPSIELAWFIALNGTRCQGTRDDIVETFGSMLAEELGERFDPDAWARARDIGLVSGLIMLGWNKAHDAVHAPEERDRVREGADLAWWIERARIGLELL